MQSQIDILFEIEIPPTSKRKFFSTNHHKTPAKQTNKRAKWRINIRRTEKNKK